MAERYLTTFDIDRIMNNLDQMEAFKCLGRMNEYIERYEKDMIYRHRWRGRA